jgi:hypothetical protein
MSIYERRDEPAYAPLVPRPIYAETPGILAWWRDAYDEVIRRTIDDWLWYWPWEITERLKIVVPEETLDEWIEGDPICSQLAWYNVLARFAESRAIFAGWTQAIPVPCTKKCPLCGEDFLETSLPHPFARRLGVRNLDFCAPCLTQAIFEQDRSDQPSDQRILAYLRRVAEIIGKSPRQGFGEGIQDLHPFGFEIRIELLRVLSSRPSVKQVKERFGTWKNALLEAGLQTKPQRKSGPRSDA